VELSEVRGTVAELEAALQRDVEHYRRLYTHEVQTGASWRVRLIQAELSGVRGTVAELEAAKAALQRDVEHYRRLYTREVDVSEELRRQLHVATARHSSSTAAAAASRTHTQPSAVVTTRCRCNHCSLTHSPPHMMGVVSVAA